MEQSALEQLKLFTNVVADTGDLGSIKKFKPMDATTNPSLILKAAQQPEYENFIEEARGVQRARGMEAALNFLIVMFGLEILKIIDGRVSTEVDARLSFDANGTVEKAKNVISLYESNGISRDRVLIKIAATWEGINAAKLLEKEGIHCNLTLLFSKTQAIASAEAEVTLISPFVGRILDWHRSKTGFDYAPEDDPGVNSVVEIFNYYKHFGHKTEIMGASFRNVGEIIALAGCDLLTISPILLDQLNVSGKKVSKRLSADSSRNTPMERLFYDEKSFRYDLNQNAMATEKLAEGIRNFSADTEAMENIIGQGYSKR
ncbi:MAG: transaldolase [Puniceicoccales bacterium]|jgi:transaldolase|nr:transaldolase [Puniceicoccales bacterium]